MIRQRKPLLATAVRSCREVAAIMRQRGYPMSQSLVLYLERRALYKIHQALKENPR